LIELFQRFGGKNNRAMFEQQILDLSPPVSLQDLLMLLHHCMPPELTMNFRNRYSTWRQRKMAEQCCIYVS